jgi:hypothetical protein
MIKKEPLENIHEELRKALVACLKYGKGIVLDCDNAAPSFKDK